MSTLNYKYYLIHVWELLLKKILYLIHHITASVLHDGCSLKQTNSHTQKSERKFTLATFQYLFFLSAQNKPKPMEKYTQKNFIWWICCGNMMHKVEGLSDFVVFCIFHFLMYANDGIEKGVKFWLKIQKCG